MLSRPNRLVIFGSRGVDPVQAIKFILRQHSYIMGTLLLSTPAMSLPGLSSLDLVSGCCEGSPDQVPYILRALTQARACDFSPKLTDVIHEFPVTKEDWHRYGRGAGPRRNTAMADFSDFGIAVYNGKSRGTHDMIVKLVKRRKPVAIIDSVTGAVSFC